MKDLMSMGHYGYPRQILLPVNWNLFVTNSPKLTAKQEAFAQLIFQGYSQHDAWMQAYGHPEYTNNAAIDVRASEVANNRKVVVRLAQLREKLSKRVEVNADTVIAGLHKEANGAASDSARVTAWGHLARHFLADKSDHSGAKGAPLVITLVIGEPKRIIDATVHEEKQA